MVVFRWRGCVRWQQVGEKRVPFEVLMCLSEAQVVDGSQIEICK